MFQSIIDFKRALLGQEDLPVWNILLEWRLDIWKSLKGNRFPLSVLGICETTEDALSFEYYCCSYLTPFVTENYKPFWHKCPVFHNWDFKAEHIRESQAYLMCAQMFTTLNTLNLLPSLSPPRDVIFESSCRKFPLVQDTSNHPQWFWGEKMILLLCQHLESSLTGKTKEQSF